MAALAGAGSATADSDARQTATLEFTTKRPGDATGLKLHIDYVNPDDPDDKPRAVRKVVERLSRRAQFDTSVPAQCEASDGELMTQGPDACPDASVVGEAMIRLDTGIDGPGRFVEIEGTLLNKDGERILVSREEVSGARVVTRAKLDGRETTTDIAALPGSLPDGTVVDEAEFELYEIENDGRSYITAPSRCGRKRRWRNRVTLTYADGVSQKVKTRVSCRRG